MKLLFWYFDEKLKMSYFWELIMMAAPVFSIHARTSEMFKAKQSVMFGKIYPMKKYLSEIDNKNTRTMSMDVVLGSFLLTLSRYSIAGPYGQKTSQSQQ